MLARPYHGFVVDDEAIGRRYLAGRYGATPNLSAKEFRAAAELVGPDGAR